MNVTFEPVQWPEDADAVVRFLTSSEWPYHGTNELTAEQAASITIVDEETTSFWMRDADLRIGLIRGVRPVRPRCRKPSVRPPAG